MKKKHILITGASRGIGYQTALTLAQAGHRVTALARSGDKLRQLQDQAADNIEIHQSDLTDPEDLSSLTGKLTNKGINLDGLIHNAGLLINKPFTDLTDDDWYAMIEVNLMGPVRLTRSLLNLLNPGSHIVAISSMGGYQESSKFPGLSGYSSSKGSLNILTECLAKELTTHKISVNCLCLGAVQTEMLQKAFPGLQAPVTAKSMGRYISDFILDGHTYYNGKILPVALSDPG